MSDADVLEYAREQFARLHVKLDGLGSDVTDLEVRMSGREAEAGHVRIGLAAVDRRLVRMDARIDRIERRLVRAEAA